MKPPTLVLLSFHEYWMIVTTCWICKYCYLDLKSLHELRFQNSNNNRLPQYSCRFKLKIAVMFLSILGIIHEKNRFLKKKKIQKLLLHILLMAMTRVEWQLENPWSSPTAGGYALRGIMLRWTEFRDVSRHVESWNVRVKELARNSWPRTCFASKKCSI